MGRSLAKVQRDLAANLKRLRRDAGYSQEALALAAEVDRTYVSQIERAVGNPSVRVIVKLSECLGLDMVDLLEPGSRRAK